VPTPATSLRDSAAPAQRLRLTYAKAGALRYISHLDFVKVVTQIMRRAELPLAYSHGYNPQARIQFAPPLPLGFEAAEDLLDIWLTEYRAEDQVLDSVRAIGLDGLTWWRCEEVALNSPSLGADVSAACYEVHLPAQSFDRRQWDRRMKEFRNATEWPLTLTRKQGTVTRDLKRSLLMLACAAHGQEVIVRLRLSLVSGEHVTPLAALESIGGFRPPAGVRVVRTSLELLSHNATV